jgi:8-oxo-dGTP pyrophosphatase MutT (NUDIX family)
LILNAVVEPRPSASVILVRDGPAGLESFMVRRHAGSRAFASAYVFPGGTVREDDRALPVADADRLAEALSKRSDTPVAKNEAAAYFVCAVRELFEEAGVLLVINADGGLVAVDPSDTALQERLESLRLSLQAGKLTIGQVLTENGWSPAFDLLVPFSHWITPRTVPARYDTRFFVAEMPRGQSALHDTIETSEGVWLAPAQALEPDYHTVYATEQHLRRLSAFGTVAELMNFAKSKSIHMVSPELHRGADGTRIEIRPDIADLW